MLSSLHSRIGGLLAGLAFIALSACSPSKDEPTPDGGGAGSGGNDSGPLELRAVEYDQVTQQFSPLADGDAVHLVRPPQGGQVIFVGVQVKNLDSNTMELTGRLRDVASDQVVEQDVRTVVTEPVPGDPGWQESDHRSISQVSNITLCPDYDPVDVAGATYRLELEVTELYAQFSTGATALNVTMTCEQTDPTELALCTCECSANYTLGKCTGAPLDAGSDAGAPSDAGGD